MKHLIFLSAILLCLAGAQAASAQDVIRYNHFYALNESPAKGCRLQLKITAKPRMQAVILINGHSYAGVLTQNKENDEPTYNCYISIKGKKKLLMLRFSKEDDCYKASLINQAYLSIFKPCPDEKYMMLESCE